MGVEKNFPSCSYQFNSLSHTAPIMVGGSQKPTLKLKDMEEKHLHNLFLKNMSGLIEEVKNPTPRLNPNSKCGGMATHAGLALELGITRKKSLSPQMEAILIWCQCRTREYEIAFATGEKFAGVPDFLTAEDMAGMVQENRIDPKMIFSYVQEVYRMCNEL